MNILFIHQNFPAQFRHIAPELAKDPSNRVVALTMRKDIPKSWEGVEVIPYAIDQIPKTQAIAWLSDIEVKSIRAEACFKASSKLATSGFNPDIIIAHPAWGESLFIKELWPNAKLAIYCEFFYRSKDLDVGFDPEFEGIKSADLHRFGFKNINNLLHMQIADAAISPTKWQASTFPVDFQKKITVIHDGIDAELVCPDPTAQLSISSSLTLTKEDEVITYVSRELEPYRGYHIFMRCLPELLKRRPKARVLIVGGNGVSYGQKPPINDSWAEIFAREIRPFVSDAEWSRIYFLGKVSYERYLKVLQISSAHVYLTYPFVLSWSLLEAMSAGCPIIASDTGPVREVIVDRKTGLLCDFFDKEQFISSITEVVENHMLANSLGLEARKSVMEKFNLRTISVPSQLEWINNIAKS